MLLLMLALLAPNLGDAPVDAGVVVEEVAPGFAAAEAGLVPGDVLWSWQRAAAAAPNDDPATGTIAAPFDLDDVEWEQAPRGVVTLVGRRGERPLVAVLPAGPWGLSARPPLSSSTLAAYEEGRALLAAKEYEKTLAR